MFRISNRRAKILRMSTNSISPLNCAASPLVRGWYIEHFEADSKRNTIWTRIYIERHPQKSGIVILTLDIRKAMKDGADIVFLGLSLKPEQPPRIQRHGSLSKPSCHLFPHIKILPRNGGTGRRAFICSIRGARTCVVRISIHVQYRCLRTREELPCEPDSHLIHLVHRAACTNTGGW